MRGENLLGGPPETLLPEEPEPRRQLAQGAEVAEVAARHPAACLPWAVLAEQALAGSRHIEAYAFARTGYHRGLDSLRRSGWKGHGPIPWRHEPNQGFLRALYALARAAEAIGEDAEADRCRTFLRESSEEAAMVLGQDLQNHGQSDDTEL